VCPFFWSGCGVGLAEHLELRGHDLPLLALALGLDEFAADLDGGAGVGAGNLSIAGEGGVDDDLQALETGAVVEFDERERLRIAARADPALQEDRVGGLRGVEGVLDERA